MPCRLSKGHPGTFTVEHKYPFYLTLDQGKSSYFLGSSCGPHGTMDSIVLILGLHRVGRPPANAKIRGLFVTPELLSFEIWLLKKLGYRFATLKDALLAPAGKIAVITFDDGYEDNYTVGLPVLERHGVPATVFVVTGDVGEKAVVWDEAGEDLPADMLTWEMLAELQSRGWEIGSHGHHHVHFDRQRPDRQESSICQSVRAIEKALGTVPISFAYPYGAFSGATKALLRQVGLRFAVTTERPAPTDLAEPDDLLELKRVAIGGRRFYHFFRCASRTLTATGAGDVIRSLIPVGVRQPLAEEASKRNS